MKASGAPSRDVYIVEVDNFLCDVYFLSFPSVSERKPLDIKVCICRDIKEHRQVEVEIWTAIKVAFVLVNLILGH